MPAGISVPLILMQFLESWPKRKRRPFPIVQRRRRRAGSTAGFTGAKALPALRRDDRLGDKGFGVRGKNVAGDLEKSLGVAQNASCIAKFRVFCCPAVQIRLLPPAATPRAPRLPRPAPAAGRRPPAGPACGIRCAKARWPRCRAAPGGCGPRRAQDPPPAAGERSAGRGPRRPARTRRAAGSSGKFLFRSQSEAVPPDKPARGSPPFYVIQASVSLCDRRQRGGGSLFFKKSPGPRRSLGRFSRFSPAPPVPAEPENGRARRSCRCPG